MQHGEKYDYYLVKCEIKLVFNDYHYCPYFTSKLSDSKTMCSWQKILVKMIDGFKNKGYNFNHIAQIKIITMADKMDISYAFFIKHNMPSVNWKLIAFINKNKGLINKLDRNWRHPSIRKLNHVPISNEQ